MDICAPFAGVVHYHVQQGEQVVLGQTLAVVEAIKLEAPVIAPGPGVVTSLDLDDFSHADGGDRLIVLGPVSR